MTQAPITSRRYLAVLVLAFMSAAPVLCSGFAARSDRVQQLLSEARALEATDPSRALALRQQAQAEFHQLRAVADEVSEALAFSRDQARQAERDSSWGALWAALEGVAHSAIVADKAVDLAVILSQADRDPRVKALMEIKGLAHTTVDAVHDLQQGDTGAALTRIVRNHGGAEAKAALGILEMVRRAEQGDALGALIEGGEVAATVQEDFGKDASALRGWTKMLEAERSLQEAAGAFATAGEFLDQSAGHDAHHRMLAKVDASNAERLKALAVLAAEYPELFDAPRSEASPGEYDALRRVLAGMGLAADEINALAPMTARPEGDAEIDAAPAGSLLDAVTDAVRRDNDEAAWSRLHSDLLNQQIGLLQMDAFERWLESQPGGPGERDDDPDRSGTQGDRDHCAGGVFQCPNGLPWPQCTHPEKHDCPPPEHRDKANDSAEEDSR